jgi:hypothetical protein
MSYDPTIGRWVQEDPIAFEGGDTNLYRYVRNRPTNATDSSGLTIDGGDPIDQIIKEGKVSEAERTILLALQKSESYKAMIEQMQKSQREFKIRVKVGLTSPVRGKKLPVPGLTRPDPKHKNIIDITIDPKFKYPGYPEDNPNPAEIADTLLHELSHAVLIVRYPNPLLPGGMDVSNDPILKPLREPPDPKSPGILKDHLDMEYGVEPIYPDLLYSDINRALQDHIIAELKRVHEQTGVGAPTLTETGRTR